MYTVETATNTRKARYTSGDMHVWARSFYILIYRYRICLLTLTLLHHTLNKYGMKNVAKTNILPLFAIINS